MFLLQRLCCLLLKFVPLDTAPWGGNQCEMCLPVTREELVCSSAALHSPQGEPKQVFLGPAHHPLGSTSTLRQRATLPTPMAQLCRAGQAAQGSANLPEIEGQSPQIGKVFARPLCSPDTRISAPPMTETETEADGAPPEVGLWSTETQTQMLYRL